MRRRRKLQFLLLGGLGIFGILFWSVRSLAPRPAVSRPEPPARSLTAAPGAAAGRAASSSSSPALNRIAAGRTILRGGWGSRAGQFGRKQAQESNPEGPMSFRLDPEGNLLVLDQVNRRLQLFRPDGTFLSSVPIASDTAQDLALDPQGRAAVLDRLGPSGIQLYDTEGRPGARIPVAGGPVREGGATTGLLADGRGIYLESEHDAVIRVADANGTATDRSEVLPGRPTRDGRLFIKAGIISKAAGRVYVQAHGTDRQLAWETPLALGRPLIHILLLDSDGAGRIYLGAEVGTEDPVSHTFPDLATLVARLSPEGKPDGLLTLPPTTAEATEIFRPLVVDDRGTVFQLVTAPEGVRVTSYTF